MDMKLVVAVGDKKTGDVVSDAMGKYYVEREGWGEVGRLGFGRRSRQGRWEAVPLLTSDQLLRLDDAKTVLTIRGHFSAVLDKLNFYTDKRFVKRRNEVAAFAPLVTAPRVEHVEEWDLFEARPEHVAIVAAAVRPAAETEEFERTVRLAAIERLAGEVFADARLFLRDVEQALAAGHSGDVAKIIHDLRIDPQRRGALKGDDRKFRVGAKKARTAARAAVDALRQAVIAERRRLHELHARLYRASQDAAASELENIAAGASARGGESSARSHSGASTAEALPAEPVTEAGAEPACTAILASAPAEETPLFGAEDLDEESLGWDETAEAAVETSAGTVTTAAEGTFGIGDSADDEGDLTWAALKRDVTGTGDSTVAFLSEAAERENSQEKAEKLRGYAARLGEALRAYSRAASDKNRLVLPVSP